MADPTSAELEDEFEEVVRAAAGTVQQYQYSHPCSILWLRKDAFLIFFQGNQL
jgi:hypothetical protein